MATDPPGELLLTPLNGEPRSLAGWLVSFHLALVVLDPFTNESAWILDTANRIIDTFRDADCRTAFLVTGTADEARQFLGPYTDQVLTFADPRREAVKAMALNELPAFVHIGQDGTIRSAAEGWDPDEWRDASERLAQVMSWTRPVIPVPGDPTPYAGSPALGS